MIKSIVHGVACYLPEKIILNKDLEKKIDTSDEWIIQRTGIKKRHIAAPDENTSDLGIKAARQVMTQTGIDAGDIDLVIAATSSPDHVFPATAARIQHGLGIAQGAAFDIQAVCAGFIHGMTVADALLKSGNYRRALVVGCDLYSRFLDWQDRNTCILFGDGAGAIIMEGVPHDSYEIRGYIHGRLWTDGRHYDSLYVDGGAGSNAQIGRIQMNGKEVFKHAVTYMAQAVEIVAQEAGIALDEIDWMAPHQANIRIIEAVRERLGMDKSQLFCTVAEHANTAAATIPLALADGAASGRLKPGDLVALSALGGGFSWGAVLLRW